MSKFEINSTEVKITKEFLLSANPPERYFEHYLGIPVKKGLFICPPCLRVDHKPTCSFWKNKKGDLFLNDFAGESYDFISVVKHLYNCSYYIALKIIANDFNLIQIPKLERHDKKIEYTDIILNETEKSKIQVETKDFTEKELKWWESFAISKNTLTKYRVYSIKHVFLNGNYFGSSSESCPMYGYYGGLNSSNDELWRIYMPTKIKYRFLSNWSGSMLQGAKQLNKQGNHCIIGKSLKDSMNLFEFGFNSISPCSENSLISAAQINKIKSHFKTIYCFFDNDLAGVKGANKYKKKYNITCIFIKRKYAKDISDLYKKISGTQFWIVVDELNQIINDKSIKNTKHFYVF